jgi:hypothetical protein
MLLISIVFLAQKRTLGEENPPEAVGLKISFKTCTRKNILNLFLFFMYVQIQYNTHSTITREFLTSFPSKKISYLSFH